MKLLIIYIYRDVVIFSGLHELIVFNISVLIFFEVIIITQVGCSSLNVFTFFLQFPQLSLLSLNSLLQGCYLRAEASDGGVLLGSLLAKCLAILGKHLDGLGLLRQVEVSLVGVDAGVVQFLLGLVHHKVQVLHVMLQLRV